MKMILLLSLAGALCAEDNLVKNPAFEDGNAAGDGPLGWGRIDGLGVRWLDAPGGGGKALRFDTAVSERDMVANWQAKGITEWGIPKPGGGPIGAGYGLSIYSDPMAISADTPYRIAIRHRGPGGGKIWVRGYSRDGDKTKRIYEFQAELGAGGEWKETVGIFHPTAHTPKVTELRVMLFAYWPAGESWFDDVGLRPATAEEWAAALAAKAAVSATASAVRP